MSVAPSANPLRFWEDSGSAATPSANVTGIPPSGGSADPAYKSASLLTQEAYAWRPPITSADSATLYERNLSGQRVADLLRNDPHARAGATRLTDMLVGAGLRVSPTPMASALGLDPKKKRDRRALQDLSLAIKSEWKLFAEDPRRTNDAQRRLSFSGQCRLLARTYATRGECTHYLDWRKEPGVRYATCVRTVDPDRLSNPYGRADGPKLRGGIEYDDRGTPIVYHLRQAHLADWFNSLAASKWEAIPRVTAWGRPVFVHAFEPDREDQSRAITPFASLMTRLRMITKAGDLELANSAVNALFAAFVSSNLAVADAAQAMTVEQSLKAYDRRFDYYAKNPPTINGVRMPILPPGDEIKLNSNPRQNAAYHAFQTAFLQSIAAALGISYEQLSMDWSKVNYSSARAALNEVWRHIQALLDAFINQAIVPIYFGVIEEAFDRGYITAPKGAPGFDDVPAAYLAARWIGPGRGYVDPVKEAQGASLRMAAMTSSLERECAEMGLDWHENLDQIAYEEEELRARGLVRAVASSGTIANDPSDDDGEKSGARQAGDGEGKDAA
jgi:lambda family phage portal protein